MHFRWTQKRTPWFWKFLNLATTMILLTLPTSVLTSWTPMIRAPTAISSTPAAMNNHWGVFWERQWKQLLTQHLKIFTNRSEGSWIFFKEKTSDFTKGSYLGWFTAMGMRLQGLFEWFERQWSFAWVSDKYSPLIENSDISEQGATYVQLHSYSTSKLRKNITVGAGLAEKAGIGPMDSRRQHQVELTQSTINGTRGRILKYSRATRHHWSHYTDLLMRHHSSAQLKSGPHVGF